MICHRFRLNWVAYCLLSAFAATAYAQEAAEWGQDWPAGTAPAVSEEGKEIDPLSLFTQEPNPLDAAAENPRNLNLRQFLAGSFQGSGVTVLFSPSVEGEFDAVLNGITYRRLLPLLFQVYGLQMRQLEDSVYVVEARRQVAPAVAEPGVDAEAARQAAAAGAEFQIRLMAEPQDRDHLDVDYIALQTEGGPVHLPMLRTVICTGDDVISAKLGNDASGQPELQIWLNEEAAKRLMRATGGNLGKQLALVYRGELIAAPVIKDAVGDSLVVSGRGEAWAATVQKMAEALGK